MEIKKFFKKKSKVAKIHKTICPTCKKPSIEPYIPFCSKRCSQIDLNRWLGEKYQININDN